MLRLTASSSRAFSNRSLSRVSVIVVSMRVAVASCACNASMVWAVVSFCADAWTSARSRCAPWTSIRARACASAFPPWAICQHWTSDSSIREPMAWSSSRSGPSLAPLTVVSNCRSAAIASRTSRRHGSPRRNGSMPRFGWAFLGIDTATRPARNAAPPTTAPIGPRPTRIAAAAPTPTAPIAGASVNARATFGVRNRLRSASGSEDAMGPGQKLLTTWANTCVIVLGSFAEYAAPLEACAIASSADASASDPYPMVNTLTGRGSSPDEFFRNVASNDADCWSSSSALPSSFRAVGQEQRRR